MSNFSYAEQLQGLSDDYYNCRIELDEYRTRRKMLLDELDREINGVIIEAPESSSGERLLDRVVGFIRKSHSETSSD
ncbi:MAG: hypothetical protein OEZ39_13050 [Gammaproteobacteria bacterium]|nr:hypothetical protein [Gammaproteobacteria bacterium]MDH5652776.1 hypothetical protein [Gammaproteobacteria bacterium]